MHRMVVLALTWPMVLSAQDASPASKWRDEQVAIATANSAARPKARVEMEKVLLDLERKEQQVLLAVGTVFRDSDPQGLDFRLIKVQGDRRRPRVAAEEASSARLDSVRLTGAPVEIAQALQMRQTEAGLAATDSDSVVVLWKEVLYRAQRAEDFYRGEDNPAAPPAQKAQTKRTISLFERLVRFVRSAIEFESERSARLRTEAKSIGLQLASRPTT